MSKEQIGTGATSRVFKGKFKVSDNVTTQVACKEFMVSMTLKHKMRLQKEINCLRTLRHPNVLKHFGVDFNRSLLITELLEKEIEIDADVVKVRSARDLLDLHELKPIPWSTRLQIVHGVTSGLSFLHKNNVIHCDLKAGNVFVGDNGEGGYLIKLGDFGTAMFDFTQFTASVMPSATKDNAIMCTAAYTAPELFEMGCKPSFESDIYSLAMIMVEFSLPNRSTPWEGEVANSAIIHDLLRQGKRPTVSLDDLSGLKDDIAKRWMTLLHDCWQQDPKKRPTSEQVALNISSIYNKVCGDSYKSFQEWKEQNKDVIYTSLNTHQTMAIDVVDEVVATFASQDRPIPPALNIDLSDNLAQNDGTNACVYFCTKIADDILCSDLCREVDNTHVFVKRASEATIRTLPALINPVREIGVFIDVDKAIALLNQCGIISKRYTTTELLKQQSSRTLREKQNYLKTALIDLKRSVTDDGKALAIYMCHPYAFIVGFVRSSYIILDTHKVPDEAGGSNSGLLLQFRLSDDNHETVTDSIVDWISLRMRASIPDYSTKIHSLVLLQMTDNACDEMVDFVTSDTDDEQLINASMEMEGNEKSFPSTEANILPEKVYVSSDSSEIGHMVDGIACHKEKSKNITSYMANGKHNRGNVLTSQINEDNVPLMEKHQHQMESYTCAEESLGTGDKTIETEGETIEVNYTVPEKLPEIKEEDLIVWKGHLTKFGLSSLNEFQMQAIQSVQLGRDTIVIQPTGSGKSLCFQLPALFDRHKFVVVVSPTLSLINSQIEGLTRLNIDAIALGRAAGPNAQTHHDRLFANDDRNQSPSIVFMTPEHFVKNECYNLQRMKECIKLIVLDEVHKMFDRNADFRSSYEYFKDIKKTFSGVPVMTLTATLNQSQLQNLCESYLETPVLIKGSIDRNNIKINIKPYVQSKKRSNSSGCSESSSNPKQEIWTATAMDVKNITGDEYAIVYMDFKSDVQLMTSSLKRQLGEENVRPYFGSGMTHETKKKTDSDFRGQDFQVLVATESYEVGTHSPHVNNIFRVGCMRNLSVVVQEFGRAGRSGNNADGFLLINEKKDDQRLAFWTKNSSEKEERNIKTQFEQSWRWVYSIYSGRCLRQELITKFGELELELRCLDACCTSCDIEHRRDFNAKEAFALLLQAIVDLCQLKTNPNGIKEELLIGWLRGSKKDTFSLPEVEELMERTSTYSGGMKQFGVVSSIGFWERVLRQAINFEFVEIKFNIIRCQKFTRVWRQYTVSAMGMEFLGTPRDIFVLDPTHDFLDDQKKQTTVKNVKRSGRGHHHLPKIKRCLENSKNWVQLKSKDQYEYPGFQENENIHSLAYVEDYTKLKFAATTRIHFIWDDNQLSKRSTQTSSHEITIDGKTTKVNVRRGPCEGVKKCSGSLTCNYVVSNKQKVNRCTDHSANSPLVSTGACPAHMVYIWPCQDDGRRWVGVVPGTDHNHPKPAPHVMSSKVKEDIQRVVSDDSTKTTKDIMKGLGMGYVPGEASAPAANADRVRKERKLALGGMISIHKDLRPLDEILYFNKIIKKIENNQIHGEPTPITEKTNEMMGKYQLEGCEYIFTPNRKYAFFMAPFQSRLLSQAEDLFIDVTYTGNDFFPYLLNIVTFNEQTCVYNAVARVLCSKLDSESYGNSLKKIFDKVSCDHPGFANGNKLRSILVDFSDAQYKGLQDCLGDDLVKKIIRGCSVHWQRSVNRVTKLVCQSEEEQRVFKSLAKKIQDEDEKDNVYLIFDVLAGLKKVHEAKKFIEADLYTDIDNHHWSRLKHWGKWWCRPNHLVMFTKAFKEMTEKDWEEGPSTTNPVESLNRQSVPDSCTVLRTLLENIYLEDRLHAVKTAACNDNVTTSYSASPVRTKRKRTSLGKDDEGPPDKRRHLNIVKRKPTGRSLLKRKVQVEYDEKDSAGNVTKYWGWCTGIIVAYRRQDGYLVQFNDFQDSEGNVVEGWADWIEDLNSKDVHLLDQ